MSKNPEDSRLLDDLMQEGNLYHELVHEGGNKLLAELRARGVTTANDDRRTALDLAIYRYVMACGGF